ncbi:DUF2934 domain-containing protein [Pararhizobium arenae]|uniref:DUF2934 domain-containing protein n=1 Tax=Pararhizobium arenae TaxID=1856850 RepID=UPI00094AF522|nr:DUF2934 domain-containing protein [Pararhizobium arenae]
MENREQRIRERAHSLWQSDGGIDGRHDEHWLQAEREIDNGDGEIGPDDEPRLEVLREAKRQGSDAFIVPSDLEDADQREAAPGTREQP